MAHSSSRKVKLFIVELAFPTDTKQFAIFGFKRYEPKVRFDISLGKETSLPKALNAFDCIVYCNVLKAVVLL